MSAIRPGWTAVTLGIFLLLAVPPTLPAQDEDTAAAEAGPPDPAAGPPRYGRFLYVDGSAGEGSATGLLVGPDVNSTLNEGARLFFRCRGDQREVFIAHTSKRLGNARQGAGGRTRFGRLQWSDLLQWGSNEAGSAAFLPPRRIPEFVSRARESGELEVQLVNPAGVTRQFRFDLAGLEEGLDRLPCFED